MDRTVDATATEQGFIGGIDDRIHIQRGDVGDDDFDPHHVSRAMRAAQRAHWLAREARRADVRMKSTRGSPAIRRQIPH
jgi:hypothetical protein